MNEWMNEWMNEYRERERQKYRYSDKVDINRQADSVTYKHWNKSIDWNVWSSLQFESTVYPSLLSRSQILIILFSSSLL